MNENEEEEERIYPRLVMLSEFEGEIEGKLKYHKSLYQYRVSEQASTKWEFRREERGPLDPGFSSKMQSYEDMNLVDVDEEDEPHSFRFTQKGTRFVEGVKNGLSKLDETFEEKKQRISEIAARNKDRSGSEIEQDEDIQEAKENPYQTEV